MCWPTAARAWWTWSGAPWTARRAKTASPCIELFGRCCAAAGGAWPPARRCIATALFLYSSAYACLVMPPYACSRAPSGPALRLCCCGFCVGIAACCGSQLARCRLSSASRHPAARRRTRATQSASGTARERRRGCAPLARIPSPLSLPFLYSRLLYSAFRDHGCHARLCCRRHRRAAAGGRRRRQHAKRRQRHQLHQRLRRRRRMDRRVRVSGGAAPSARHLQRRGAVGAARSGARGAGAIALLFGSMLRAGLRARERISAPRVPRARAAYLPPQPSTRRCGIRVTAGVEHHPHRSRPAPAVAPQGPPSTPLAPPPPRPRSSATAAASAPRAARRYALLTRHLDFFASASAAAPRTTAATPESASPCCAAPLCPYLHASDARPLALQQVEHRQRQLHARQDRLPLLRHRRQHRRLGQHRQVRAVH